MYVVVVVSFFFLVQLRLQIPFEFENIEFQQWRYYHSIKNKMVLGMPVVPVNLLREIHLEAKHMQVGVDVKWKQASEQAQNGKEKSLSKTTK